MRYEISKIIVHDQALFLPGGDFYDYLSLVKQQLEISVTREAPIGHRPNKTDGTAPGHLASTVFADISRAGLRQATITVGATADYTVYVVKGTSTIFAKSGRNELGQFKPIGEEGGMYLPPNPGYGRGRWRQRVRGQSANNFIARGFNDVASRHASMKPIRE